MKSINLQFIALMVFVIFSGCAKNEDDNQPVTGEKDVQLKFYFNHRIDNAQLYFDSVNYQNAFGNVFGVSVLKYFVSDFKLIAEDGSEVLFNEEHYVDASDMDTRMFVPSSKISAGKYTTLKFVFGLTAEKNVDGRYVNPPESLMEWPPALGHGYHYMKLEGKFNLGNGTTGNYQAHFGPSLDNSFYLEVELPLPLEVTSQQEKIITIGMDINKWWDNPNTLDLNNMTGIMGNPDMQQKLHDNGADVFSLESIE